MTAITVSGLASPCSHGPHQGAQASSNETHRAKRRPGRAATREGWQSPAATGTILHRWQPCPWNFASDADRMPCTYSFGVQGPAAIISREQRVLRLSVQEGSPNEISLCRRLACERLHRFQRCRQRRRRMWPRHAPRSAWSLRPCRWSRCRRRPGAPGRRGRSPPLPAPPPLAWRRLRALIFLSASRERPCGTPHGRFAVSSKARQPRVIFHPGCCYFCSRTSLPSRHTPCEPHALWRSGGQTRFVGMHRKRPHAAPPDRENLLIRNLLLLRVAG